MKERVTNMTKVEAVKEFSQAIATNMLGFDPVGSVKKYAKIYQAKDKVRCRTAWNDFVDCLVRDGRVTESQANCWICPKF
jgi:hypothetical protein